MIILLILLISLHILLFYNRQIRFYKKPYNSRLPTDNEILSCVEGTVVYARNVNSYSKMVKGDRSLELPNLPNDDYYHIGIYMSPYNNHHLLSLNRFLPFIVPIQGALFSMLDDLDSLFPWSWRYEWYYRKLDEFISLNQRYEIRYNNGIVMCMIMDKYVNKLSMINQIVNDRMVIGFVHRGSQLDIFLPWNKYYPMVSEGQKVDFNTVIAGKIL